MFDGAMGRRQRGAAEIPKLNLNSMMDMLSIILVFLLANISAEEQDFVIAKNLNLPSSDSTLGFSKAVQVKLTRTELLIEDTFVAKVSGTKIVGADIDGGKIVPLYNMLQRYRSLSKDAEKTFPFEVLNQVMRTAAMAGYPNVRFAIQKK